MSAGRIRDVVVVGAGPAGALAARELARAGRDVLLVEKSRFPRDKVCGCCLGPAALAQLAAVGLDAPDGPSTAGIDLRIGRRRARLPLHGGRVVSRRALDASLAQAARDSGAEVRMESPARLGPLADDHRLLHLPDEDVAAHLVLAADGLGGGLLPPARPDPGSRVGLGASLARAPDWVPTGRVTMACGPHGYVGLVRDETGGLRAAAAVDAGPLRDQGAERLVTGLLTSVGLPALDGISWHGSPPLSRARTPYAERVLALGDAAGYVEPFTGEGMGWALASARAVRPLVLEALEKPERIADLGPRWARTRSRVVHPGVCRVTAALLRRPTLLRVVVSVLHRLPHLATPLLRRLQHP